MEFKCIICRAPAHRNSETNGHIYECPKCGIFSITHEASTAISEDSHLSDEEIINIAGFLRDNSKYSITKDTLPRLRRQRCKVSERGERLLRCIAQIFPKVGKTIVLSNIDLEVATTPPPDFASDRGLIRMLVESRSATSEELRYLITDYLKARGFVQVHPNSEPSFSISPTGWDWLQAGVPNRDSHIAFVAMSFNPDLEFLYDVAINPATEVAGYKAVRIDKHQHVNRIDDEIIANLRKSRFCIADFTEQKNGVYFEAGFALGLQIPVIWSCREDELKSNKLHFDTRQFNMLEWNKDHLNVFRDNLKNRIEAIIGVGPLKRAAV